MNTKKTKRDFGLLDFTDLHGSRVSVRLSPEQVRELLPLLKDFIETEETSEPCNTDLREKLAALEHERWSRWEKHREDASIGPSGEQNLARWRRQRETPYEQLTEQEKESDRAEVDQTLALLASEGEDLFIIFDGPPSHESGCFVEVETRDGRSVSAGGWVERSAGLWSLGPFRRAPA